MAFKPSDLSDMPTPVKLGAVTIGGGGLLFGVNSVFGLRGLICALIGLVVVVVLLCLYAWVLRRGRHRRAEKLSRQIKRGCAGSPAGISSAENIARLDELRGKFEKGLDQFHVSGKSMYDLPWFVLVGEPGSGKTEAIRHSNVGFPPGMHEEFQGVGGTLNMNWWFSNYAVILDTAGRLMFDDVQTTATTEWKEFLALLKKYRPNCPINGLVLVISAGSLITDTAEEIESKGAKIAQQFDSIQRVLDIRFPVFVLVTKCDLINGFREFFDRIRDPQAQHQMLGWSNPAPIDEPFSPDRVSSYLDTVRRRLHERRLVMLSDLEGREGTGTRPIEEADTLYDFPRSFERITPRLKRYLQIVFAAGEWSRRPLFLRGIYFNSSMREGAALDSELAEALGVPVVSLPEGRVWDKEKAYFLRDVWVEKVFKERGLVTRASNTRALQRRRKTVILGTAFAGLLLLGVLTWFGARSLNRSVLFERHLWAAAADTGWIRDGDREYWLPIVYKDVDGLFAYGGMTPIRSAGRQISMGDFHGELRRRASTRFRIPMVFRLSDKLVRISQDEASFNRMRTHAHRQLVEAGILAPLVHAAQEKMALETEKTWSSTARDALGELVRLEAHAAYGENLPLRGDGDEAPPIDLDALLAYVLADRPDHYDLYVRHHAKDIKRSVAYLYGRGSGNVWPPEGLSAGPALALNAPVRNGLEVFVASCSKLERTAGLQDQLVLLRELRHALVEITEAQEDGCLEREKQFLVRMAAAVGATASFNSFNDFRLDWQRSLSDLSERLDVFKQQMGRAESLYGKIALFGGGNAYEDAVSESASEMEKCIRSLLVPQAPEKTVNKLLKLTDHGAAAPADEDTTLIAEIRSRVDASLSALHSEQVARAGMLDTVRNTEKQFLELRRQLAFADRRFSMYAAAGSALGYKHAAAGQTLDAGLDALMERVGKAKLAVSGLLNADDSLSERSSRLCQSACDLALHGIRYEVLDDVVLNAPSRAAAVEAAVARQAENFEPLRTHAIALVPAQGERYDSRYHPEAAAAVFQVWSDVRSVLEQRDTTILDRKGLQRLFDSRDGAYRDYAEDFLGYWTRVGVQHATVVEGTWSEFRNQLLMLRASAANATLEQFCEGMADVLASAKQVCAYLQEDDVEALVSMTREGIQRVKNAAFQAECQSVLRYWGDLPASSLAAREAILGMRPADFGRTFLLGGGVEGNDIVSRYWAGLSHALLSSLAAQVRNDVVSGLRDLRLSRSDLLKQLQLSSSMHGDQTLGQGAALGVARTDEVIQRMRLLDLSSELTRQVADRAARSAEDVEKLVAGKAAELELVEMPAIPLTGITRGQSDPRFHPKAAVIVFREGADVRATLAAGVPASPGDGAIQKVHDAQERAYRDYSERFRGYWLTGFMQSLCVAALPWPDFHAKLVTLDGADVHANLATLCANVCGAIAAVGETDVMLTSQEWQQLRGMAQSGSRWLADGPQRSRAVAAWRRWQAFPADALDAREELFGLTPEQFRAQLLPVGTAVEHDIVSLYWHSLVPAMLRAITDEAANDVQVHMKQLDRYKRFPLALPGAVASDLTPAELDKAFALISRVHPFRSTAAGESIGDGAQTGVARIDELIAGLRSAGVSAEEKWLVPAHGVGRGLITQQDGVLHCKVRIVDAEKQKKLLESVGADARGGSVLALWRIVSLLQGELAVGSDQTAQREDSLMGSLRYPGNTVVCQFQRYPSDAKPAATATYGAPWGVLRMLHAAGSVRSPTSPRAWYVRVQPSGASVGNGQSLWLELEFERELPDLNLWPRVDTP